MDRGLVNIILILTFFSVAVVCNLCIAAWIEKRRVRQEREKLRSNQHKQPK